MRKLINSTYITLDGVIDNPMWTMPYFDEEAASLAGAQTTEADAMLMGRATYDGFSAAWPNMDESDPTTGAAYFNNVKKYVASTTLTDPTWNNTEVLQGDLVEAVTALKAQEGKNIIQYGFGSVTAQLIKAGLVDEVRFWIHPVLEGGPSLTSPLTDVKGSFDLIDTRVHKSGVIVASYAPKTTA
ncbi:dihydrofolate reductase family protein [Micromonospora parathelypteridis]|uniref:Dihydrofolate reductase n=1 Tax=Micromonospora parathelypteridis TaxID=1839617 RepID=A0A840VNW5_9ACTN|nr:dihydrofolate reductase family protein [Micromonospora parathelypteridis]MBB5475734.1 dihydrofolate reductase [Micromonospora parathelypteridis]GGO26808.1 pyrimidine reductase [Micromonospora parathelypteridis]